MFRGARAQLFDFTLHTTSNALLFLVLAAIATMNGRVEDAPRAAAATLFIHR